MFEQLWVLSLEASGLILLILLIRVALKRWISPNLMYALWMILLLKPTIPWTFDSPVNLYEFLPGVDEKSAVVHPAFVQPGSINNLETASQAHHTALNNPVLNETNESSSTLSSYMIAFYIWTLGIIFLFIRGFIQHHQFHRKLMLDATLIQDTNVISQLRYCQKELKSQKTLEVWETSALTSPALYGWFRPKIFLPSSYLKNLGPETMRYIFYHEITHWHRKDIFINLWMYMVSVVHWFNPLVWFAYTLFRRDQEVACDATVLSHIPAEKHRYGAALIGLMEHRTNMNLSWRNVYFQSKYKQTRRRIEMISKFKKSTTLFSFSGIILLGALAYVAFTSISLEPSKTQQNAENSTQQIKVDKETTTLPSMDELNPKKKTLEVKNEIESPSFLFPAEGRINSPFGWRIGPPKAGKEFLGLLFNTKITQRRYILT